MKLEIGGELTVANDIFGIGGNCIFQKGRKVTIMDIWKKEAEEPYGITLREASGLWFFEAFEETKTKL